MGERTLVMEERQLPNGEEPANDFKMSVYEGDTLKSEQQAEIRIPPNMVGPLDICSLCFQRKGH